MKVSSRIEAGTRLCSDEKTREEEDGEGMRLVECLRGRLFAERQASRAAKEEAEVMGKRVTNKDSTLFLPGVEESTLASAFSKSILLLFPFFDKQLLSDGFIQLVELERKLREETKLRDKARRKLEFLEKKFECFEASTLMGRPGRSIESCDGSCRSSSTASLEAKQEEELNSMHISLPRAAEEDRSCESGEKQRQLKSDFPSDVTSSSSRTRAVAVYPAAHERKEPKKANSNGGGASQNDRKHRVRAQCIGS